MHLKSLLGEEEERVSGDRPKKEGHLCVQMLKSFEFTQFSVIDKPTILLAQSAWGWSCFCLLRLLHGGRDLCVL